MQQRIDRHTRMVAWAKVALPLVALAILSTLFLLSRSVDPIATIPFSESDLAERTESQQISEPQVYGVSQRGDLISLSAVRAKQSSDQNGVMTVEDVRAQIDLISGHTVDLRASQADLNEAAQTARLSGSVRADTSTGYLFETEALTISLTALSLRSDGAVEGSGPIGHITAGSLELTVSEGEKDAQILLKGGVNLVYTPPKDED